MSQAVNSIGEPLDPEHVICVQRSCKHVVAEFGSEVIADSHNTLALIDRSRLSGNILFPGSRRAHGILAADGDVIPLPVQG